MPTSHSDIEFIKKLFMELDSKVDNLQLRTDTKLDSMEEKLLSEIKDFKKDFYTGHRALEDKVNSHEGHFKTIKLFVTTGIASLIAFYSWILSIVHPSIK